MSSTPSRLHIGGAYYPEHWPEEHWAEDIRLIREAGFTVVRLAEFAWFSLEPAESQFNFDWLERAIAQLSKAGILTVLGTPTAAPGLVDPDAPTNPGYGRERTACPTWQSLRVQKNAGCVRYGRVWLSQSHLSVSPNCR